ncbi:CLUMA_CG005708, isoform A [Clunio marinus]|uniref:CLUMA_CG005708, isoform A n=1 Tax=Clunio marinus TaxID=568069 RepID=A0A1J1HY58_9DIPT|nr:CLUMA_CG005708, isoform A [Clunio marinus]
MMSFREKLKLVGFAVGIFACYTTFGVITEKIFRGRYGDEVSDDGKVGETFKFPITFGGMQCIFYMSFAKALMYTHDHPKNETHQGFYALIAIFYVLGKVTSHLSLQWIPYPTQIIGKASKPIPVMLFGVLIGGKRIKIRKVIFVLMIVFGVMLFVFKDKYEKRDGENPRLGNTLIGISLLMDGLCGASEDRMRSISKPTPLNFMHFVNVWSSIILVIGTFVFGEAPKFVNFITAHPEIIKYLALAIMTGGIGQIFISSMVSHFGPLPLSIVTTTRKFFSVFLSVIIFGNSLSARQWTSAGIIFGALFLDAVFNKKSKINTVSDEKTDEQMNNNEVGNSEANGDDVVKKEIKISVINLPNDKY